MNVAKRCAAWFEREMLALADTKFGSAGEGKDQNPSLFDELSE